MNNEVVIMLKNFRSPTTLIVLLAGLAGLSLVLYAWRLPPFASSVETTENAYVRGYVTTISHNFPAMSRRCRCATTRR